MGLLKRLTTFEILNQVVDDIFCTSYFIAKERKSVSSHTNRFKPITAMSINKDTSNTEIWKTGNDTGSFAGSERGANPKQIICDVSTLFCTAYMHGYTQAYVYNIPYWSGLADGQNFADFLIKFCHAENHPKIPGYHSQAYKSRWNDGYNDETNVAFNDDGTYGENCH
jgi:hypothetical protein